MSREVPSGWSLATLESFVEEFKVLDSVGNLPPLSVTKSNGIVFQSEKFNKRIANASSSKYKVVRSGEYSYDPMSLYYGAIGRLNVCDAGIVSPAYVTFRLKGAIERDFFDLYVKTSDFLVEVNKVTEGGNQDGKRKKTDWNSFCSLPISVPPLHEQRRIAEILSSVDGAIAATRAVIEQTRKVKQGVLERLLTKGIGHTRFKQTEIGEIPEGWTVESVDDLCVLSNGNGFRPPDWADSGLPIIRIQNLNGSQNFNYFNGTPLEKWLIYPGDLLFAWAGVRGVSFGPTIWSGPLGVLNQHIFKISCRDQVDKSWLFYMMRLITARIESKAHGFKDSLLHVHKKDITGQLVPVPSHSEQVQISARLAGVQSAEELAASSLRQLLATKSALMSDLLTGRKRVTDALPMAAE